ncbi:hypothetical protein niasHT_028297 [Heterodera trifolii]|uniref:Integrase catalytic domain-containing protein n=1 Tax=Heterodera trifolii TaxID=157864 RepID=A0ABD2JVK0_9BILA
MDLKKQRLLEFLYKDINSPVAFTSVEPLLREARKQQQKITRSDVQNFLSAQRTYTLHRQAKRRYRRLPTLASGLHTEWQADLAILDRLSKHNRGFKYLLVCIDTLSRQIFVEPTKSKTSTKMIKAFEKIFKRSKYFPWKILTDQGKEFTARAVQTYFRSKNVEHFCMLTSPQFHAGMAERANRSIKERLYRYFTERKTQKWIDIVQDIVKGINHSINSTIGMRPIDVTFENAEQLRQKLYNEATKKPKGKAKFKVGERVRIEKHKHVFQKGYLPRFTKEIFTVAEVHIERSPIVYRLQDDKNEIIKGWFYANDLCKTLSNKEVLYDIEEILKKKNRNGVEYAFVKWKGYGTVEQQFVEVEWQTGNTVRIEVPPSNVTNPHELSKSLYKLLGEGSEPLAKKVRTAQNAFANATNTARRWAREEYIKRKSREKRSTRDEEKLLEALLINIETIVDIYGVAQGLIAREKRAETSKVPLRTSSDENESYQQKLDEYFSNLYGPDLNALEEMIRSKLNDQIRRMAEEDRAILESTKEMGMEAWIQAYRKVRFVCQFIFDTNINRFELKFDSRYVKKVKISSQLSYILGFNKTEFVLGENEAKFMPDMNGGVSSFHVYTPNLIEPMMIGDVTAPVLRIVTIRGKPDEWIGPHLHLNLFNLVDIMSSEEYLINEAQELVQFLGVSCVTYCRLGNKLGHQSRVRVLKAEIEF